MQSTLNLDCWLLIENKIYNKTTSLTEHPTDFIINTNWITPLNQGHSIYSNNYSFESCEQKMIQMARIATSNVTSYRQKIFSQCSSDTIQQKNLLSRNYSPQKIQMETPLNEPFVRTLSRVKTINLYPAAQLHVDSSDQERQILKIVRLELAKQRNTILQTELDTSRKGNNINITNSSSVLKRCYSINTFGPQLESNINANNVACLQKQQKVAFKCNKRIKLKLTNRYSGLSNQENEENIEQRSEIAKSFKSTFGDKIYKYQSATTLQKSVLSYSVPKANRFVQSRRKQQVGCTYFLGSCFQPNKMKGTSFGYGQRKPYPQWLQRNMKEYPAPNSYHKSKTNSLNHAKGCSFGLSYHYYDKATVFEPDQVKKCRMTSEMKTSCFGKIKSKKDLFDLPKKSLDERSPNGNYHFKSKQTLVRGYLNSPYR